MTRDFSLLSSPLAFLDSEFATKEDNALISQLEIWSISSRIFDTFGVDPEMAVSERLIPQLQRLSISLKTWRTDWTDRIARNGGMGTNLTIGIDLHFYFAKLYLCSHVFRGSHSERDSQQISSNMKEFAHSAMDSAASIVRLIVDDRSVQSSLAELPTYYHTMLAFAAVFLLKIARRGPTNIRIDRDESFGLMERFIAVLTNVTAKVHQQHSLYNIATSIRKLLQTTRQSTEANGGMTSSFEPGGPMNDEDWPMLSADFLLNHDFLWPQDTDFQFDFSEPGNMSL
jgi:hypothetical protein